MFGAFFLAFAIKVPLFPLHTWLPDAHTEAPTAGSVILAGVMLKLGTYGILRFCVPLFPDAAHRMAPLIAVLAIIGIVYGALVAMVQTDLKRLVAYTSVSHLGFVVLGIFAFNVVSIEGAVFQMLSHGISTGALFLGVGMLYDRRHTFEIKQYGGLATPMPVLMSFFLFISLSSLALPPLNGFIGEFLILIGTFAGHHAWAAWASSGAVLSAVYLLWAYQRVALGDITVEKNRTLPDASGREKLILATMAVAIIFMGVASPVFTHRMEASVNNVMEQVSPPRDASRPSQNGSGNRTHTRACTGESDTTSRTSRPPRVRGADGKAGGSVNPFSADQLISLHRIAPELVLCLFGIGIMIVDPFVAAANRRVLGWMGFVGTIAALAAVHIANHSQGPAYSGLISTDAFSIFVHLVVIVAAALAILGSLDYLDREGLQRGEYYALVLFAAAGMCILAGANELVTAFIGLEMSSISTYVLVGFRRRVAVSNEASLKYFLLGSFATAFFLYGIAMVYGATGTTVIDRIPAALVESSVGGRLPGLAILGLGLMFVGLGFKVVIAPFQIYGPDVYEGAPTPVTALLASGPKAATFALMVRVLYVSFGSASDTWFWVVWISAVLTMCIGNLAALVQTNVKRMLAYSSIAHAGYILVAFAAVTALGMAAVLFYLAAYVVMKVGAFLVVTHLGQQGEKRLEIRDYAGLGMKQPVLAGCFSLFLLSLLGLPATGGFLGKFFAFQAALQTHEKWIIWLVVIAAINSVIGSYYYLRVIISMYFAEPSKDYTAPPPWPRRSVSLSSSPQPALYISAYCPRTSSN